MIELREKCTMLSKELVACRSNSASQDAYVLQLKGNPNTVYKLLKCIIFAAGDCQAREEKAQKTQAELRHLLESLAIALSTPSRFVESSEDGVKSRIREILDENKEKRLVQKIICNKNKTLAQRFPNL